MATLKKRADGRYQKNVYVGRDASGKKQYKSVFGRTQKEVNDKVMELKLQIGKGLDVLSQSMKFKDLCQKWLIYKKPLLEDKQYKSYKTNLKPFDSIGDMPINKLVMSDFQMIINSLAIMNPNTHKPTSKKTLRDYRITARQVFDFAVENRILDYNPLTYVKIPKDAPQSERRALTEEEQKWIFETEHRCQLPAMIMMLSGLRLSEALAFQWKDIDLENNQIFVHQKLIMTGKPHIEQGGKSKNSIRIVNVPSALTNFLNAQGDHKPNDVVCLTANNKLYSTTAWRRLWDSYLLDLNLKYGFIDELRPKKHSPFGIPFMIERFTAHQLRHTFATNLFFCGQDLLYVQNQLGHAKPETTLNIYTHLVESKKIKKTDKIINLNDYLSKITQADVSQMLVSSV